LDVATCRSPVTLQGCTFHHVSRLSHSPLLLQAFPEATTRRVLCTQWIEGEKLSESNADDVRQLCSTLLNAYLIQLLEVGAALPLQDAAARPNEMCMRYKIAHIPIRFRRCAGELHADAHSGALINFPASV
jgi:hypothetical protein